MPAEFFVKGAEDMIIENGLVFTPSFEFEKMNIKITDDRIEKLSRSRIEPADNEETVNAEGMFVIPGLTDVHFHGAVSYDFCDATPEAIHKMAVYERSVGVTQICPATMTLPEERVAKICKVAYDYNNGVGKIDDGLREADLVGINLEGPYISPNKVGAQNPAYVKGADKDYLKKLLEETEYLPKLITIAPEEADNLDCIDKLHDKIRFSVGHTVADYKCSRAAFEAGARHMTHLYNAMPSLTHRAPGPIAAGSERDDVTAELICDGIHIAPGAVRAAFKLFGADRIVLISDSARAVGMPDGTYELGGQPVYKHDGAAWLNKEPGKGGTLAGSTTNLFDCMLKAIEFDIKPEDAVRAATYNPAYAIGILKDYGTIEEGKKANILLLNKDYSLNRVI